MKAMIGLSPTRERIFYHSTLCLISDLQSAKWKGFALLAISVVWIGLFSGCHLASLAESRQQVAKWGVNDRDTHGNSPDASLSPPGLLVANTSSPAKNSISEKQVVALPEPPISSSTTDWLSKSDSSMRDGNWAEVIRTASVAIHRDPDSAKAYINRSFAYNQKEFFKLAIADSNKALTLDPLNVLALVNRCYAEGHSTMLAEAKEDCLAAIDLAPDFSMPYNMLGFVFEEEGLLRDAALYYEMSCNLNNNAACQSQQRITPFMDKK